MRLEKAAGKKNKTKITHLFMPDPARLRQRGRIIDENTCGH